MKRDMDDLARPRPQLLLPLGFELSLAGSYPDRQSGDYLVIAGTVSGPAKQPKNEAESDRWLKSGAKSGISATVENVA